MKKQENNLGLVKEQITSMVGKCITFKDKDARLWYRSRKIFDGVIRKVYPHHFLVEILGQGGEKYNESFSYADLLTGQYRIMER